MTYEITDFASFNFSEALNKALEDMNFTVPSPIQVQTIPLLLEGRDAIALAQTGTGKTAAFACLYYKTYPQQYKAPKL